MTSVPREHPGSLLQTAVGWMISCEIIFKRLNCVGSNRPGILESSILFLFDWVKSIYSMAWNYASGYLRHDDTSCMSLIRTTNFTKLREVLNSLLCDAIMRHTVFFKTRGHLLVWAPPRLASSGLAWPCLAMPCHALSCLAWVWMWRFFVKYKKWDS